MEYHKYDDFDPNEEVRLSYAAFHFGDRYYVNWARDIEATGINSQTNLEASCNLSPKQTSQHLKLVSHLQSNLIASINRGEYLVFGHEGELHEKPTWIRPGRCQHLQFRFLDNQLISKFANEPPISNVKLFKAPERGVIEVNRSPKKVSAKSLSEHYELHVDGLLSQGKTSNRELDYQIMNALFDGQVTHAQIKKLRSKYAPKEWQASGRRKSGGN